jgi:hypothetical protein
MRAWIGMAFGDADNPYGDEPSMAYAYDDQVQNHKQVQVGDLLFLRNRTHLEGVGRIEAIAETTGQKTLQRCPECGTGRIHQRKHVVPRYRCMAGHEFAEPRHAMLPVRTFKASFAESWLPVATRITAAELRPFELRDSRQLAIMPADTDGLCRYVARRCPNIAPQLIGWYGGKENMIGDMDAYNGPDLTPDGFDERQRITRAISLRRGQPEFRNSLMERYARRCVMSGCGVIGVLEAAHIRPYRGSRDNHPANGLLLRSDLHTLFDLNRIAIEPDSLTIAVHPDLLESEYGALNGKALVVTAKAVPDKQALLLRWKEFTSCAGLLPSLTNVNVHTAEQAV